MSAALLVAAGAFLGGISRWALARAIPSRPATLAANVVASVILGASVGAPGMTALIAGVGFAGALSTWSTFANQVAELVEKRQWRTAAWYLAATLALCVVAAWRGSVWSTRIWG